MAMAGDYKDMHRWLGNGGMPIIGQIGGSFLAYGVDGEDLGWVEGAFTPTDLAGNPHGIVQAGIHSLVLDAAINFAINAAMRGKDRTKATLELKTETMRAALVDQEYVFRGDVVRMTRQVAFGEGVIRDREGGIISRATATFLLHRVEE